MCGIAGIWDPRRRAEEIEGIVCSMMHALTHRGPDDAGMWTAGASGLSLAHRRLAVLDLSSAGHQPMRSACGRYVMVYNGEIYNYAALRRELEQARAVTAWRGHSDTEVALAAIARWGVTGALQRFVGMFALALWDESEHALYLARDRVGEKPLYYGAVDGGLVFASELKALRRHPRWDGNVDRTSLAAFLRYSYVPTPASIYTDVYKLRPGTILRLMKSDLAEPAMLRAKLKEEGGVSTYWSALDTVQRGLASGYASDEGEAEDELNAVLGTAVKGQMISDAPLGAFLSGGVDSSTVVALMQAQSTRPVRTFTIGFREDAYDEAEYARRVARHLGTDHTELYITPADALDVIPRLPTVYDEPFADSSQIPTLLLAALTRSHVTVSLSGDGGDELFGGYNRYFWGSRLWRRIGWLPAGMRSLLGAGITAVSPPAWSLLARRVRLLMPAEARDGNVGDKLHKLAEVLPSTDADRLYEALVSLWKRPDDLVVGGGEPGDGIGRVCRELATLVPRFEQRMMLVDLLTYLPDDILVKLDRAAMSVSLESRLPFLDHRVVELAWRLPLNYKLRNGSGKWLLRRVLHRYVPRDLVERPKRGFGIPLDAWLRGPLREWAESLLDSERLQREGFLDPAPIRRKWEEHLAGRRNWQHHLWNVLAFQAWLEQESHEATQPAATGHAAVSARMQ